jgi:hypothetical protein
MEKSKGMSDIPEPKEYGQQSIRKRIEFIDNMVDGIYKTLINQQPDISKYEIYIKARIENFLETIPESYLRFLTSSIVLLTDTIEGLTELLIGSFQIGNTNGIDESKLIINKIITEKRLRGELKTKEEFENEYNELLNSVRNSSRELEVAHTKVITLLKTRKNVKYQSGTLAEIVSDEDVWRALSDCKMGTGRINLTKLGNIFGVSRHTAKKLLKDKKIKA